MNWPALEPALAEVVDLQYFCGFPFQDCGDEGPSERTARRQWTKARAYLHAATRAHAADVGLIAGHSTGERAGSPRALI